VQGHRFDIFEEIGCFPEMYNSWLSVFLVSIWPIVIGLVSLSYCTRTIYHIHKRQVLFKELLSSHSDITAYRYIRLMCLAGIEALCTVPIATYILAQDLKYLRPFGGWDKVHWRFSRVSQYPSILWRMEPATVIPLEMTRWSPVACAFIFFIFFGFADEARKHYRLAYTSVAKRVGYTTATSSTAVTSSTTDMRSKNFPHLLSTGKGTIPIDIRKETVSKRDSFGSFNLTIVDVGGTLDDYKAPIFTPTASSGSSSSPTTQYSRSSTYLASPTTPDGSEPPALARPQPALDITNVTRRSAESSPIRPMRPDSLHLEVQDDAV
jgi:pheromone a factor receptor